MRINRMHRSVPYFPCLILMSFLWSSILYADDYPTNYIDQQLADAQKAISINLDTIEPGQIVNVSYVGRPVWIYRRTAKDIEYLSSDYTSLLADPRSNNLNPSLEASYSSSASYVWARLLLVDQPKIEQFLYRSRNNEYFVMGGWSPQTGCKLNLASSEQRESEGVAFYDPCHGAIFNAAGRMYKRQLTKRSSAFSSEYNLYIPPHRFEDNENIVIGINDIKKLPKPLIPNLSRYSGKSALKG